MMTSGAKDCRFSFPWTVFCSGVAWDDSPIFQKGLIIMIVDSPVDR